MRVGLGPNSSSTSISLLGAGVFFCLDGGLVDIVFAAVADVRRRLLACPEPARAAAVAAVVVRRVAGGIASEKELAGLSNRNSFSSRESKKGSVDWDSPVVLVVEESWVVLRSGPKMLDMQLVERRRGALEAALRNARDGSGDAGAWSVEYRFRRWLWLWLWSTP